MLRGAGNNDSVFKLPITNDLGIDANMARSELKTYALTNPSGYSDLRNDVYKRTVTTMVLLTHELIWKMLGEGEIPILDGNGADTGPIVVGRNRNWKPSLPDSQIAEISNGFAKSMMESFTHILERFMPQSFAELADNKLLASATINIPTAPGSIGGGSIGGGVGLPSGYF